LLSSHGIWRDALVPFQPVPPLAAERLTMPAIRRSAFVDQPQAPLWPCRQRSSTWSPRPSIEPCWYWIPVSPGGHLGIAPPRLISAATAPSTFTPLRVHWPLTGVYVVPEPVHVQERSAESRFVRNPA
jgi:hypothetical protein